jgi:hypothetical protein
MIKFLGASALLLASTAALAQTAPADAGMTQTPPAAQTDQTSMPTADMSTQSTGNTETMSGTAPATAATAATASSATGANIGAFDLDSDGGLNPVEYAQWWASSQAPAGGAQMTAEVKKDMRSKKAGNAATELLNQTSAAFLKADANDDNRVTPDELASASTSSPM